MSALRGLLAVALTVAILLGVAALAVPAPSRVRLIRPPAVAVAHQPIELQVQVEAHADHRLLVVVAADEVSDVRGSSEQLAGDAAPRTRWLRWREGLPAGQFVLIAALYGIGGEVARDTSVLEVRAR